MAALVRIILASILLFILIFILYSKSGRFTLAKRIIVGALIVLLVGIIVFYEISYTKRSKQNRELLDAFVQNKTLVCEEREITAGNFTFVGGTQVFTLKDRGEIIISIDNCKVK
ncbi:MAG: hypothetical protein LBP54_04140 [Campylobacteraceae bacterium]|jgi:chromate transport protein ChrA|nr:hypothetical protein [Campylobacteraceae bacterium]